MKKLFWILFSACCLFGLVITIYSEINEKRDSSLSSIARESFISTIGSDTYLEYVGEVSDNEAVLWMPVSKFYTYDEGKQNFKRLEKADGFFFCYLKDKDKLYFIGKGSRSISKDAYDKNGTVPPLSSIFSEEKIKTIQLKFLENHTNQVK
ncbi:hypothetical protein ACDZ28_01120 (plasmid) [Paenibacillus sp. RS8]|uniref:hypothetical protein n=1 Tax=Paenibacillus sp. RS8 TaxID=3242681 RepID=UPI0035BED615